VKGELAARAAPLLRLAANGQAVAATSRHLGRGRKMPRCRGASFKARLADPRRDALAFAVQLVADDEARLGQGDVAPGLKRCAPASPLVQ
jgi:hypothetical protein